MVAAIVRLLLTRSDHRHEHFGKAERLATNNATGAITEGRFAS